VLWSYVVIYVSPWSCVGRLQLVFCDEQHIGINPLSPNL